jgi:hypothetical protein
VIGVVASEGLQWYDLISPGNVIVKSRLEFECCKLGKFIII